MNTQHTTAPTRLQGAQLRIRNQYFEHESGLFVLNSVPGSGKSVVSKDIVARELLRRYINGNPTPEQQLCVVSFNKSEAKDLIPGVAERIRELVEHGLTPVANSLKEEDVEYLVNRLRDAPYIGTIDSVFRGILDEFTAEVGFEESPEVGNELQLENLHRDCYTALQADPALESCLDTVQAAYPSDDYQDGPAELLRKASHQCRARRLSPEEFAEELRRTVNEVYKEGETETFSDIAAALTRVVGAQQARKACSSLADSDKTQLVEADRQLREAWLQTISVFETLLKAYTEEYSHRIREHGVISHTDAAYLVSGFLNGAFHTDEHSERKHERVISRFRNRVESLIIDEAQDVSRIQHAALSQLIDADTRVFAAGDLRQTIYVWREAHPSIFKRAINKGHYLGINWNTHETETTTTTYRSTPDVASAINSIAEPTLLDADRGNIGPLDVEYPPLTPHRDPTSDPNIHIAAFESNAVPSTPQYVDPDRGKGEAGILATYIANGLDDGTFDVEDSTGQPDIMVLFRWRTHMERYAQAFDDQGLTVANASKYLFDSPSVNALLDVAEWLTDPHDTDHLQRLVTGSALPLNDLTSTFTNHSWSFDAVLNDPDLDVEDRQSDLLKRLQTLRDNRSNYHSLTLATVIADMIDTLGLRADPYHLTNGVEADQRVANLDALVAHITEWEKDTKFDFPDLPSLIDPFRNRPYKGPTQPLPGPHDHDVIFKTVHDAKGGEADIIALADPGWNIRKHSPVTQRLITADDMIGIAPPANAATTDVEDLHLFTSLYDPDPDNNSRLPTPHYPLDVGFRWVSEHWADEPRNSSSIGAGLIGHEHLQTAPQTTRSEAWRLLYVALTRTRNHLVIPLPREVNGASRQRDRWLESIRENLEFDGTPDRGTYSFDVDTNGSIHTINVAVNNVEPLLTNGAKQTETPLAPLVADNPPETQKLPKLVPRFIQPSSFYPLSEQQNKHLLNHLLNKPLHTETDTVDDSLPLTLVELTPEGVGTICHDIVTAAIAKDISADALHQITPEVQRLIDIVIDKHGPFTERDCSDIRTFLGEYILPQLSKSEVLVRLDDAQNIFIEKPLRGVIRVQGLDYEIDGNADIVARYPDGKWEIVEVKTSLSDINSETRKRYQIQVDTYASLLRNQAQVSGPVVSSIEVFGAHNKQISSSSSSGQSPMHNRLENLCV